jgi:chemotaxis protein histidine kinase CheA
MNLDPAPRQPKLVYLAIDAGLLITAFIIVFFAKDPYAPLPFVSAVLCVVLAAVIGLVPFLTDYAADSAEYVQAERGRVTDQVQRLHAATESLNRAAAQIKAVEEAVHKTAHAAENLPYRMQEKLAEFNEALAEKETDDRDALERELDELRAANSANLKAVADKIAKASTELAALEKDARTHVTSAQSAAALAADRLQTAAQDAATKINAQLADALAKLDARLAELRKSIAAAPAASIAPIVPAAPIIEEAAPTPAIEEPKSEPVVVEAPPPVIESVTLTETPAAGVEEPKPKKPRAPRKPKPEDTLTAMSAEPVSEPVASAPTEIAPAQAASEEPASVVEEAPAKAESSASSDGATRLLVTAYIGIGNKLFIRGDGPGLSWDKGVPMQFVSIGKWGWASHEATGPVKCKLYKNDETAALSGEVSVEPGKHVEVSALF